MKDYLDYRLCYVDNIDDLNTFKMYFTDNFENQRGDDWDDRPANCNAEEPYTDNSNIETIYVHFSGYSDLTFGGKIFSVDDMNLGKACWLICENTYFEGGDTLKEILDKIKSYNDLHEEEYRKIHVYIKYKEA